MDYWDQLEVVRHLNYDQFRQSLGQRRVWAFTTKASKYFWDVEFRPDDVLLFGPESRGLPGGLLAALNDFSIRIPMVPGARSLNLSSAAAIALYEALRQTRSSTPAGLGNPSQNRNITELP